MNEVIYAFQMTIELWVFLGVLAVAAVVGELVDQNKQNG